MMTLPTKLSRFQLASLLILLLAAVLRFLALDYPPLQDLEAIAGLRAGIGTPDETPFAGLIEIDLHQPALENLMRVIFQLSGSSTFKARFIPALAGLLFVLTPHLARKRLGYGTTLTFSFLLAVSPIFVTFSRTASGMSLALLGLSTWLMTNLEGDRKNLGAVGMGLALASGPSIFNGLLILAAGVLIYRLTKTERQLTSEGFHPWVIFIVVLVLATSLGWSLGGLSNFFESIGEYFNGWKVIGPFSLSGLLILFPIYAPLLTFFSLMGIWKVTRGGSTIGVAAIVAVVFGLGLIVFYRQRSPEEIGWIAWILTFLAAEALAALFGTIAESGVRSSSVMIMFGLLILFAGLIVQLSRFLNDPSLEQQSIGLLIFIAALGGILILVGIFSLGWSWSETRIGILLAFGIGFLFLSVSSLWHLNFRPYAGSAKELWRDTSASEGLLILENTLKTVSEAATGIQGSLAVEFYDAPPPSMLWALRDDGTLYTSDTEEAADVVMAREGDRDLNLNADYLGQSLSVGESWGWLSTFPPDFMRWWFHREPPVLAHRWWMLFRSDLILDPELLEAGDL